jgi:hypothetical protein
MSKEMYAEEVCGYCDGFGCDACADTGFLYTEEAIRMQMGRFSFDGMRGTRFNPGPGEKPDHP